METDGPTAIPARRLRRAGAQPPTRIAVQLLGGFRILVDGSPVDLTPVAERLVAILGLQGRTSRSRLAGMLWPDTPECRALASLRTGIWRVNQAADALIVPSPFHAGPLAAGRSGRPSYVSGAAAQMRSDSAALDEVTDYEGDLLPDWDEQWLLAERERLRQLRLHLLEQLAQRLATAGKFGLALEAAFAALSADPLRESAHRTIIGIHMAEGNTGEARRAFETCRRALAQDLGVAPLAGDGLVWWRRADPRPGYRSVRVASRLVTTIDIAECCGGGVQLQSFKLRAHKIEAGQGVLLTPCGVACDRPHLPVPASVPAALVVVVVLAVQAIGNLYLPDLNADIINNGVVTGDTGYILRVGGVMLAVTLVLGVARSIVGRTSARAAAMGFGRDVRGALFRRVERFSLREVNEFGAPSLITRNTNDVQQVQMLVLMGLTMMVARRRSRRSAASSWRCGRTSQLSALLLVIVPVMAGGHRRW